MYYFGCDLMDCCPCLYCGKLKHTMFRPLYPPAFICCPLTYVQIIKGHLRKAGGYSSRNVVFQFTIIKMRTTVRKITTKIIHIPFCYVKERLVSHCITFQCTLNDLCRDEAYYLYK